MAITRRTRNLLRGLAPAVIVGAVAVGLVVVISALVRPSASAPEVPIPVVTGDWPPYVGADLPDGGPVTTIVSEVLQRAGYVADVTYAPWSLAEDQVTRHSALAAFPLVGSASRRERFLVSDPIVDTDYVLFYNAARGRPVVRSAADLGKLRVGGISGYDYWPEFDAAVPHPVLFKTSEAGFAALASGRIDLLAEGELSGHAVIASERFAGDASMIKTLTGSAPWQRSRQRLYLMVARTSQGADLLAAFDAALADFKKTDRYPELVSELTAAPVDRVTLSSGQGLVTVYRSDGRAAGRVPDGSSAVVQAWPEGLEGRTLPAHIGLVKVKIVSGPARGRVTYVRPADTRLVTE